MARRIAIIGGGASGTLTALHLCREADHATSVTVVEPRERLGEGVAYGTTDESHLLNVAASGMSAYDDKPNHFAQWAACTPDTFVPRRRYAEYLRHELAAQVRDNSLITFRHLRGVATQIDALAREVEVSGGSDSTTIQADAIVLALGNAAPATPEWVATFTLLPVTLDPWAPAALDAIPASSRVLCVGTGLTFVDVALTLARRGVRVTGVSRHGLLPEVHAPIGDTPSLPNDMLATLQGVTESDTESSFAVSPGAISPVAVSRWIRSQPDWRAAFTSLRPVTQRLWRTLSSAQQAQFLRLARRYWDVHRHRMAANVAAELRGRQLDGLIQVRRGDARTLAESGTFSHVVLCTGPDDSALLRSAPLAGLVADGSVCAGPHGMGIATDAATGQVHDAKGAHVDGLYAIGPLRRGTLWESTAVPEISIEARRLAALLLA